MYEDSIRRHLGIDKKCKIGDHSEYHNNLSTTRHENDDNSMKNFKKKFRKNENDYIFNVNMSFKRIELTN